MQKKTIAVKKSSHRFDEGKCMFRLFVSDIDGIICGKYATRMLMGYMWQMFWSIEISDCEAKNTISEALLDMTYYCVGYDAKGCINAAKHIKEVLRDCGMWNID